MGFSAQFRAKKGPRNLTPESSVSVATPAERRDGNFFCAQIFAVKHF